MEPPYPIPPIPLPPNPEENPLPIPPPMPLPEPYFYTLNAFNPAYSPPIDPGPPGSACLLYPAPRLEWNAPPTGGLFPPFDFAPLDSNPLLYGIPGSPLIPPIAILFGT